jgi:4'-phosphopantetheinyl transferase
MTGVPDGGEHVVTSGRPVAVTLGPDRDELVGQALALLGLPDHGWTLGHACRRCGSERHGAPYLLVGGRTVGVSLSRAAGLVLVAVAEGRVGVDLEEVGAAGVEGYDDVVRHAGEPRPGGPEERARRWVRKEASLKLLGTGLDRDPASVDVGPDVVEVDGQEMRLVDLSCGAGLAGCVAVEGRERPRLLTAGPATPPRRATP